MKYGSEREAIYVFTCVNRSLFIRDANLDVGLIVCCVFLRRVDHSNADASCSELGFVRPQGVGVCPDEGYGAFERMLRRGNWLQVLCGRRGRGVQN